MNCSVDQFTRPIEIVLGHRTDFSISGDLSGYQTTYKLSWIPHSFEIDALASEADVVEQEMTCPTCGKVLTLNIRQNRAIVCDSADLPDDERQRMCESIPNAAAAKLPLFRIINGWAFGLAFLLTMFTLILLDMSLEISAFIGAVEFAAVLVVFYHAHKTLLKGSLKQELEKRDNVLLLTSQISKPDAPLAGNKIVDIIVEVRLSWDDNHLIYTESHEPSAMSLNKSVLFFELYDRECLLMPFGINTPAREYWGRWP